MKEIDPNTVLFLGLMLLMVLFLFLMPTVSSDVQEIKGSMQILERLQLYDKSLKEMASINGIYMKPSYFAVWTKGRTAEQIGNTNCHESSHDFVYKNWSHFCEWGAYEST